MKSKILMKINSKIQYNQIFLKKRLKFMIKFVKTKYLKIYFKKKITRIKFNFKIPQKMISLQKIIKIMK